jgi:hypothetical protein
MRAQVLAAMALAGVAAWSSAAAADPNTPPPPTIADPIKGLDLWRGAKVGMTVTDVRRLFPLAAPPEKRNTLTGGQVDLLQLPSADLDGRPATAHFYFAGPELVAVELTASGFKPGERISNMALAKAIADRYAASYGPGYDCGSRSLGDVDVYECKWLKGRLSIQLWYMDVAGQAPLFYVAYRQADDPSYNL